MSDDTKRYEVRSPVKCGDHFAVGSVITLDEKTAAPLLAGGEIAPLLAKAADPAKDAPPASTTGETGATTGVIVAPDAATAAPAPPKPAKAATKKATKAAKRTAAKPRATKTSEKK